MQHLGTAFRRTIQQEEKKKSTKNTYYEVG
jgi:hypothetical protein